MKNLTLSFVFLLACSFTGLACGDRNLSEFTAPGDLDSGPGIQAALDALATCTGGTLTIDAEYNMRSGIYKDFLHLAQQIIIRGTGSNARIRVMVGGSTDAFSIHNLNDLLVTGVSFLGEGVNGAHTADASNVFRLHQTRALFFKTLFVGLGAITPNASTIRVGVGSIVTVDHNLFLGCRSVSAFPSGTIVAEDYGGLKVTNTRFLDYTPSYWSGLYYSTNGQAGLAWIVLFNPHSGDILATPSVVIEDCEFDEGGYYTVLNLPSIQLQSMKLNRNKINVGAGGGYVLHNIKYLEVDGGLAGLRPSSYAQADAIRLVNVQYPTIKDFVPTPTTSANRLSVDAGTIMLKVINSPFATIVNHAQGWQIEDGANVTTGGAASLKKVIGVIRR